MYNTCKILGLLLSYPEKDLIAGLDELEAILVKEALVPIKYQKSLSIFFGRLRNTDLLELQEQYVELFDRTPPLSLHLFEHVYGESRERGQAMVDLASRYQEKGLVIKKGELPDYLPLFLEFLSVLPPNEAKSLLGEPINIIAVLNRRLKARASDYSVIFDILEHLSSKKPDTKIVENVLIKEKRDVSVSSDEQGLKSLDVEWEEKPIQFMRPGPNKNCHPVQAPSD